MRSRYRANFGDGTHSKSYPDIRDARREKRAQAAIVQWRTGIECCDASATFCVWTMIEPSRSSAAPVVTEVRKS